MQFRSSISLAGGILSGKLRSLNLAVQYKPSLQREAGQAGKSAEFDLRSPSYCRHALMSNISGIPNALEPGTRRSATEVLSSNSLNEPEQILLAAACQAAAGACCQQIKTEHGYPGRPLLKQIGKIDLLHLLAQRPRAGSDPVIQDCEPAMSVLRHLAVTPEGAALALRLTRQRPQLSVSETPALERYLQKLVMYYFMAQALPRQNSDPEAERLRYCALSGIRHLLRNALKNPQGNPGFPYQLGKELCRLPPKEGAAIAVLRNNLWDKNTDNPRSQTAHQYQKTNEFFRNVCISLQTIPSADETKSAHIKRVAGKIIGGKIDTAMTALKYLPPQRPAPNATRNAQDTYLVLNQVITHLEQRLDLCEVERPAPENRRQRSLSPSKRMIHSGIIGFASHRPGQSADSFYRSKTENFARSPELGRHGAHSLPVERRCHNTARQTISRLARLDLSVPADKKLFSRFGLLLILRKQKEIISRFINNLPASMGVGNAQNRVLGRDMINTILGQPELMLLPQPMLEELKNILYKYDEKCLDPHRLDKWLAKLRPQPPGDGPLARQEACGNTNPPAERLTKVKAQGNAETRARLKQALKQLAGELHFGKQFSLLTASGHLASTRGIVPVFTGGIFDVFVELAKSKGMKFTIGNNSTGTFLEVKWSTVRSGDVNANAGLPLATNPVIGASVGLGGSLAGQTAEGIIFRFGRDASFHSDPVNNARLGELMAFLIDHPVHKDEKCPSPASIMALFERFPDVSIAHVTESKTKGSIGISANLSLGPKLPHMVIGATAGAGIGAARDFSDKHSETGGHNCRSLSRKAWVVTANATAGMRTGINLAGTIRGEKSGALSNRNTNEIVAQAADNIVRAPGFMGSNIGVDLNLCGYAEEYAEHVKDGEVQPNTSWRAKTFFNRSSYLAFLRECGNDLIDSWSSSVACQTYGGMESEEAKTLYSERRQVHQTWLTDHIASVNNNFNANTTYTMNYDLRPDVAKKVNQYRAACVSLDENGHTEKAREYKSIIKSLMRAPESYKIANILVNRVAHTGRERSLGILAYGTHVTRAEENTFDFYGPIPNKHIMLNQPKHSS